MDKVFDIWVNLLPALFVLNIYLLIQYVLQNKQYWFTLYGYSRLLLFILSPALCTRRGNLFICIVMSVIMIVYCLVMICFYWKRMCKEHLLLFFIALILIYLFSLYSRVNHENIMKIPFADDVICTISEIVPTVIQNEWLKGISISALGGIISGLVLIKISKKK